MVGEGEQPEGCKGWSFGRRRTGPHESTYLTGLSLLIVLAPISFLSFIPSYFLLGLYDFLSA